LHTQYAFLNRYFSVNLGYVILVYNDTLLILLLHKEMKEYLGNWIHGIEKNFWN